MPSGTPDPATLRPLTAFAWGALRYLASNESAASHDFNPGVWNRLRRESLVEPFFAGDRTRYRITAAGRQRLRERDHG
jgi:hypothetical protein